VQVTLQALSPIRHEAVTRVLVRSLNVSGLEKQVDGGAGGIRTLDRALQPYNGLANRRLQPLGHSSGQADMPDAGVSRKRQIPSSRISSQLATPDRRDQTFDTAL
jgi:hypothetical protein